MAKKRKTKKDKIILSLKRELAKQNFSPKEVSSSVGEKKLERKAKREQGIEKTLSEDVKRYRWVKKDLTRSLGLAILIIALEFLIYWRLG